MQYKKFFSRLSYSFGNEDWKTEKKALRIQPKDRVVCITASGDRPLNLLLDECEELVSVDLNEIQNHLLNLKVSAMNNLQEEEYLSFLGATKGKHRLEQLTRVLPHLQKEAQEFWGEQKKAVSSGILYQGAIEKVCSKISFILNMLCGAKITRLFTFNTLEEQQKFVEEEWNKSFWKKVFWLANPLSFFLNDPGLFHLGSDLKPSEYLYSRFNRSLNRSLAKENLLLSLLLRGYVGKDAFPPYLTQEGIQKIKGRLHKLSWRKDNLITFLENSPSDSFDCFSLSDIASYMDKDSFIRLLRAVLRAARPGARFSLRQFMTEYTIPEDLQSYFVRDKGLEEELEKEESCFVYRFTVGTIQKVSRNY